MISVFDEEGNLIRLADYPRLGRHLRRFRDRLEARYIVRTGAPWYRTIDRVRAVDWRRPKLLVPEIAKVPRVVLDPDGLVPSHGVYAIFPPEEDVEATYDLLRTGSLETQLRAIAPSVRGGYLRCYKRFLSRVRI